MLGTRIASIPYSLLRSGKPLGRSVYHLCGICYHTLHYLTSDASYPAYCTERVIEIPWILGRIRNLPRSTRILEVGCVLGQSLARLGYNVDTVDLSSSPTRDVPRWHIIREDICRLDAAGAYDAAVSISTLEHIGLGHYGDPVQPDGDRRAVERIAAALKPGGHLYVTTPFAERAGITWQRFYDMDSLRGLFEDFSGIHVQVYFFDKWRWRTRPLGSPEKAKNPTRNRPQVTAVALVEGVKGC